ncbi:MAG: glutamine--tRNA ligase/YqeY domain fusion protein, partial [Candidatus Muiribacteriota bacterium]
PNARCHLRFDDTNPEKEEMEYINSIMEDVKWLGFDWGEHLYYASDYFQKLYEYAVLLIKSGKAYVDNLSPDEIREHRGTLTKPGINSPHRDRTVEENLALFEKMKNGEYEEGEACLRAKIDMASPNIHMRDPVMYRIKKTPHPRTGDKWVIYPMYDYTHCMSDSFEKITHSLCTLEFEDNRPLYNWFLDNLPVPSHPRQIEFARLDMTYCIMSKRHLMKLVKEKYVNGWDDPRMPTISGMRRRGYTPAAIREFCSMIGLSKASSKVDYGMLEYCLRQELNFSTLRRMAVLEPLKIVITNYPEDKIEELEGENNPENPESGTRKIKFSNEILIEKSDFMENPPNKFFRLKPGGEVRLKHAYIIKCEEVIKDENGEVIELRCTYDTESRGGNAPDGRKIKGTLHWVCAKTAVNARVNMYGRLFKTENPGAETGNYIDDLNPESLTVNENCMIESGLASEEKGLRYQFLRQGYFYSDPETESDKPEFNLIVTLKDTWAKINK